jgi:CheY-like chemotaxis protein
MSLDQGSRGAREVPIEAADAKVPVLLVDDTPANLLVFEAVLSTENYELRTARSGREAIREIEQHDFAVVLASAASRGPARS